MKIHLSRILPRLIPASCFPVTSTTAPLLEQIVIMIIQHHHHCQHPHSWRKLSSYSTSLLSLLSLLGEIVTIIIQHHYCHYCYRCHHLTQRLHLRDILAVPCNHSARDMLTSSIIIIVAIILVIITIATIVFTIICHLGRPL